MIKTIAMAVGVLSLAGCASILDPNGASSSFSCTDPNNPDSAVDGVTCKTPFAIYKSTNEQAPLKESDLPIGVTLADYEKQQGARSNSPGKLSPQDLARGVYADQSYQLPGQVEDGDAAVYARPVRVPAMVMRIWIAPWVDSHDDLHYPSHIYTEVQARRWAFGESEFTGRGVTVPTKQLSDVPAKEVKQDGRQPRQPTEALKPYEPVGMGGQMPKLP